MIGSTQISKVESARIDAIVEARAAEACEEIETTYRAVPAEADEVSAVLAGVSPSLVDATLLDHITGRRDLGMFQVTIGSTDAPRGTYLVETVDDHDSESSESSDDESVTTLFERSLRGEIDLDDIKVSAAHARRPKGIDAEHLSKIWRIESRRSALSKSHHSIVVEPMTLPCHETMERMTGCYDTNESLNMDTSL